MNNIFVRYSIFFLLAILLQATIIPYFTIFQWKPDLVVIVLTAFAFRTGYNWGTTAGFFSGLITDLLSAHLLGLNALSKTIAGYTAASLGNLFQEQGRFIVTLLITSFVHDMVYFFVLTLGEQFSLKLLLLQLTIPNTFYTVLVGAFIYYIWNRWFELEEFSA